MILADYHMHSHASFDCFTESAVMAQAAIDAGLAAIAFTDHIDFLPDTPLDWQTDFDEASREIADTKDKFAGVLDIALGVEFGQPQYNVAEATRFVEKYQPDFIIGSVHHLDPTFDIGMSSVADHDPIELYRTYLDMMLDLATNHDFDVLGHLTYPWRYFKRELDYDYDAHDYRDQLIDVFDVLVSRKKGLEINTSGLRQPLKESLPNETILRWFFERGGEIITTGSDAHTPAHVGYGIAEVSEMAQRIGFPGVATYRERQATIHSF
jgi:histidinol-phosphatase (PHP family)